VGLPSSWKGLAFDVVKGEAWSIIVDRLLGGKPSPQRPQTFEELPPTTQLQSRLAGRLGLMSYQSWSSRQSGSPSSINATSYESYLASTSAGRLLQQTAHGSQYISRGEIDQNHLSLARTLQQAGFNPANPQPPPSGSK
jgi:hypothetical protein